MFSKLLAVSLFSLAGTAFACCDNELKEPSEAVKVVDSTVTVTKIEGSLMVTVLGAFKNTTETAVSDLVVEAKLVDAAGKLVDVVTQPVYGIVVPAGQQVSFRMQAPPAANESVYAGVQARVSSGQVQRPRPPRGEQKAENRLLAFLISWGPMLLLILVWLYLTRKYNGKGSIQHRSLDLIADQNAILSKQLAAIESIAASARGPSPKGETPG